jgi:hypothetical protein
MTCRGVGPVMTAALAGQITFTLAPAPRPCPGVTGGKLRDPSAASSAKDQAADTEGI